MTYPALAVVKGGVDSSRTPPNNTDVEQALLGILLLHNDTYFKVFEIVKAEDFYDPVHGRIYDAIAKTVETGRMADARTLRAQFDAEEALKPLGGGQYLADLAASVITSINVEDYAKLIYEFATRRRLIAFSNELQAMAFDQSAPPSTGEQLIAQAETKLLYLAERRDEDGMTNLITAWNKTLEQIGETMKNGRAIGLKTGLTELDEKLGGLHPGTLYTIAARPAMGKTAMALTIATNVAKNGGHVLFNTLEVVSTEIVERIIARLTGFPPNKLRGGEISIEEFQRIFDHTGEVADWPLYIDDTAALTVAQIRGRAIRRKRRYGLHLLVIDYLGLVKAGARQINRNYQIEEITQGLKNLAKELNVPVLLLAQLNRDLEKRDDKRPMLADLRDSGSIEQDSDAVMFIYRHEHYITREAPRRSDKESAERFAERETQWSLEVERSRHKAELIIAKLRQGDTGTIHLGYEGWRFHFFDLSGAPTTSNT